MEYTAFTGCPLLSPFIFSYKYIMFIFDSLFFFQAEGKMVFNSMPEVIQGRRKKKFAQIVNAFPSALPSWQVDF